MLKTFEHWWLVRLRVANATRCPSLSLFRARVERARARRDRQRTPFALHLGFVALFIFAPIGAHANQDLQDVEASLSRSERQIRHESKKAYRPVLFDRHISLLRAVGRDVEADALRNYITNAGDGVEVDADALLGQLKSCDEWMKLPEPHVRLARPSRSRRLLKLSPIAAEYQVDRARHVTKIDVVLARSPAMAWALIKAVARARVGSGKLKAIPEADFPVDECVFWANGLRVDEFWIKLEFENADTSE